MTTEAGHNPLDGGVLPEGSVQVDQPIQADAPTVTPIPEGGAEKFYNPTSGEYNWEADAREKAFQLSQKTGQTTGQPATDASQDSQGNQGDNPTEAAMEQAVSDAGIDFDAINASIASGNGIPQDALDALAAAGIPQQVVDVYMGAIEQQAEAHISDVMSMVGGESALKALGDWAMANLPPAEFEALQEAVNTPGKAKPALAYYMNQAGMPISPGAGVPAAGQNAVNTPAMGVVPFASEQEFLTAVSSKEHRTNPEVFKKNMERLKASPHLKGMGQFNGMHRV